MRVVIAEDATILRAGLVQLIEEQGHVVAAAVPDGRSLRAAVAEDRPDIVVSDIRMPSMRGEAAQPDEGVRAALDMRSRDPELPVLLFSQYVETQFASRLLASGSAGIGYLLKERVLEVGDFFDALERVAAGGTALDPEVVSQLLGASRAVNATDTLSPREHEVMALIAEGRSNSAIAETLFVTGRAVEKHVANIFTKLDLPVSTADHRRVLAVLRYLGV
jgi:DNA-binding NarL/FixJ family response regulator